MEKKIFALKTENANKHLSILTSAIISSSFKFE